MSCSRSLASASRQHRRARSLCSPKQVRAQGLKEKKPSPVLFMQLKFIMTVVDSAITLRKQWLRAASPAADRKTEQQDPSRPTKPSWNPGEALGSLNPRGNKVLETGGWWKETRFCCEWQLAGWQDVLGKWHDLLAWTRIRTRTSAQVGSYCFWDPSDQNHLIFYIEKLYITASCECVYGLAWAQLSLMNTFRKALSP